MIYSVWNVRARGGDPVDVRRAVIDAVALLRSDGRVDGLSDDEQEHWRSDVPDVQFSEPASVDGWTSVLVTVPLAHITEAAQPGLAAVLSGGFDAAVLDAVMAVPGVNEASHSDRIEVG